MLWFNKSRLDNSARRRLLNDSRFEECRKHCRYWFDKEHTDQKSLLDVYMYGNNSRQLVTARYIIEVS